MKMLSNRLIQMGFRHKFYKGDVCKKGVVEVAWERVAVEIYVRVGVVKVSVGDTVDRL